MQIKRFEAKDMTTALKSIKKELGPEAVILSARSLKVENRILGSTKTAGVEVTAAIDTGVTHSNPYAVNQPPVEHHLKLTPSKKKVFIKSVQSKIKSFAQGREQADAGREYRKQTNAAVAGIVQHLLSQGVRRNVAEEIVERLKDEFDASRSDFKENIISKIAAVLEEIRNVPKRSMATDSMPKVQAFIGPTGVGKTTAIAKLAVRQMIQRHKKVALITVDSCRIGAVEELNVYGKAINIPVSTAGTPSALEAAIKEYRHYDYVLVDTPGINVNNPDEIDALNSYLKVIRSADIHLLLSAGGKTTDLFNFIERLHSVSVHYLAFTKLDESTTVGNLINLLFQTQLPLSFLSTGRQVPDSLTAGSADKIVRYLLAGYQNDMGLSMPETARQIGSDQPHGNAADEFVANKNSDVFHYPDCKWTQKIKPKNMITFSSVQAATAQQFMPCRDCQPGVNEKFQAGYPENERMRISSYL